MNPDEWLKAGIASIEKPSAPKDSFKDFLDSLDYLPELLRKLEESGIKIHYPIAEQEFMSYSAKLYLGSIAIAYLRRNEVCVTAGNRSVAEAGRIYSFLPGKYAEAIDKIVGRVIYIEYHWGF